MASIKKIRVAEQDYDIAATAIEPMMEIPLSNNGASVGGSLSINSKGNVAIESLLKHVNIEAANSIQMKPTKNIIIDTGRRVEMSAISRLLMTIIQPMRLLVRKDMMKSGVILRLRLVPLICVVMNTVEWLCSLVEKMARGLRTRLSLSHPVPMRLLQILQLIV